MKKFNHPNVLNALLANCKKTDRKIAKGSKVSQPTVTRIRRHLEENGIIKGYFAIPDYAKIGFQFGALTLGHLRPEASLKPLFSTDTVILHAPTISGNSNFMFVTVHKSIDDYDAFLSRIKALTEGAINSTLFTTIELEIKPVQVHEERT